MLKVMSDNRLYNRDRIRAPVNRCRISKHLAGMLSLFIICSITDIFNYDISKLVDHLAIIVGN